MNRIFGIILVFSLALVGVLYSLPKVVVKSKATRDSTPQNAPDSSQQQPSVANNEPHTSDKGLTAEELKKSDELRTKFASAATQTQKVNSGVALSDYFLQIRRFDSAAVYAEKVALIDPTERNVLIAGDRYYDAFGFAVDTDKSKKMGEKTREWYQKVLDRNPNILIAKANMAMTYVSTENPMQGIMMLREIIATDPTNEVALFNLGLLSMRSNQYQKAVDRFAQVVKNNPKNVKARFYLGVSLAQLGKNKEALAALAIVKQTEKDPNIQDAVRELEAQLK